MFKDDLNAKSVYLNLLSWIKKPFKLIDLEKEPFTFYRRKCKVILPKPKETLAKISLTNSVNMKRVQWP